ncbi:MAG: hypothetical protein JNL74_17455 [Fibrobacteres bacterium]|nr:hypothetical protein [Fibrobacterota bacterium]
MKTLFLVLLITSSLLACGGYPERFFSFGPICHWNFGDETRFSVGIEVSYWRMDGFSDNYEIIPIGFDIGIDYQPYDKITRVYTEVQASLIYGGFSAGPGIEFGEVTTTPFVQGSLWAGLFGYADLRVRKTTDNTYICPGLMVKCPFLVE